MQRDTVSLRQRLQLDVHVTQHAEVSTQERLESDLVMDRLQIRREPEEIVRRRLGQVAPDRPPYEHGHG